MKLKLLKGKLKEDDGKPLKAGESVFSDPLWTKLKAKEGAEAKLKTKLKVKIREDKESSSQSF